MADASRWSPVPFDGKPGTFTAICPGQLGLRKGTFDLLEAWNQFWPRYPDSQLILAGLPEHGAPPAVADKLRTMAANTPRVKMVGWIDPDRMRDAYANAHVLVMPSWEDGGTCTGPEAALCGLPIIATRNAGIDVLLPGATGWEVPYGSPIELATALEQAAKGRDLLHLYSQQILELAQTECSMNRYSRGVADSLAAIFA
jgi:glycosyltransferase involved in cell wall biosynthesis